MTDIDVLLQEHRLFPPAPVHAFGIVQSMWNAVRIKNNRRSDNRPGKRPAPGLVGARYKPSTVANQLQLNGKIRPQRQLKKGRRIGCAASHDGDRLGTRDRFSASPPGACAGAGRVAASGG